MTALDLERFQDDGGPAPQQRDLRWTSEDGRYDGQWWPRTDDPVVALTTLLPLVQRHTTHPVTRATLRTSDWSGNHPSRVWIDGHLLRIGWFPQLAEHTVTIGCGADPRLVLLTHPSKRGADDGEQAGPAPGGYPSVSTAK